MQKHIGVYQKILLFTVTALIFLNLTVYLPQVHLYPLPAYTIDLLLFMLFIAIYLKKGYTLPLTNKIFIWLLFYVFVNLLFFVFSPTGPEEFKYLKIVIFFIFFIFYMTLFFNLDDEHLTVIRRSMIPLAMISVVTLALDYTDPMFFYKYFGNFELADFAPGRAAAIFGNANAAGGAMVIFLIFTIDFIPKHLRLPYIVLLFTGLFFTMSRSNIMLFMIVLIIMLFQHKLRGRHLSVLFVAIFLFFAWLASGGLETLGETFDFKVTENMQNRVNFFADKKKADTSDMDERKEILKAALEMFADKPILGNGFAATRMWHYPVGPHNTFAVHWAEFGFLGVLIIPLLIFLSSIDIYRYGTKEQKQLAILVSVYFVISCFFSHNMLEQPFNVAILVAIASMGYQSRRKQLSAGHYA